MSLPDGFLDELRDRISLSHVVGRKLQWDMRKSNQARGDMWAPCPFHQEKTASFHVDDGKGFYYCFGCHAKGDAITFVRETENVDFIEAVRILAGEAGMQLPERDPEAQARVDRRTRLIEVMEQAARFYRRQLAAAAGHAARAYLDGRGLRTGMQERFGLGYAPAGWQALREHLTGEGVDDALMLACGLLRESRKGGAPYDAFRNRVIFPIRDARGRCIAFGGRALDPNDDAKYINSPETDLYDKSRTLYNLGPAREAAGKGQPLIVAEGYMDVISLVAGGFEAAVAPLGTAVTEAQLAQLWRVADEPVIALDGDAAGLRAAWRVMDLALPLLEAGKSLRFALLPSGCDPDDLLRAEGAVAMQRVLDAACPMVDLLWQRETEGRSFDSPERRAALDKALRERLRTIHDPSIRHHYGAAIKEMRWQFFDPRRTGNSRKAKPGMRGGGRWEAPMAGARPTTRSSLLAAGGGHADIRLREAVILATLLTCPALVEEFEAQIERMPCDEAFHARLRGLILHHAPGAEDAPTLAGRISSELGGDPLEKLTAMPHLALMPPIRHRGAEEHARMTLAEELAKIEAACAAETEISEAQEDMAGLADETVSWRLGQVAEARSRAMCSRQEDRFDYETGENGVRVSRDEKRQFDDLLDRIGLSDPDG